MNRSLRGEVELRYTSCQGKNVVTTLAVARPDLVAAGLPVRTFGSYAGMRHYPGWWWSVTTGDLVGYESLLERDRLMLADFDRGVVAIASQPFGITGDLGGRTRRHVPDYLLRLVDGAVVVVDVKPATLLDHPEVAPVLDWTASLMAERGWRYEVWSGAEQARLTNVRFLGQGRRHDRAGSKALAALVGSATVAEASAAAHRDAGILCGICRRRSWRCCGGRCGWSTLMPRCRGQPGSSRSEGFAMATGVLDVRVGTRLWFDGQVWTVCEVHPGAVRLRTGPRPSARLL